HTQTQRYTPSHMHTQFTTEPPFVTTCMALDLSHWCSKSTCFTTAIPWRMKQQINTQTHFVITPLPHSPFSPLCLFSTHTHTIRHTHTHTHTHARTHTTDDFCSVEGGAPPHKHTNTHQHTHPQGRTHSHEFCLMLKEGAPPTNTHTHTHSLTHTLSLSLSLS